MEQNFGFQIEKLSSTIEELELDQRAYHILKHAGIHFVSDIIACGEWAILNLRNMGPVLAGNVFSLTANFLNVSPENLFDENICQAALLCEGKLNNPLKESVTVLDLSPLTIRSLAALGIYRIEDLLNTKIKTDCEDGRGFGDLQYVQVRRIYRSLDLYLKKTNWVEEQQISLEKPEKQPINLSIPVVSFSNIDLGIVLKMILVNERISQIVGLRAIHLLTLEEIAVEVGVTRERIRQIIDQVQGKIQKNLNSLKVFCDYFEEGAKHIRRKLGNNSLLLGVLVDQFKQQLPNSNIIATDEELESLIAILRLLVIHDKTRVHDIFLQRWEVLTFLACLVNPPIKKHEKVDLLVKRDKEKNRKVGYKELAHLVLQDAKEPLHWSEIVDRAYRLGRRNSFNSTALYNALMSHPNVFVRVDAGTYALLEWGYSQAEYYPDIIGSILKSEKSPLPLETIYLRVNQTRNVRRSTLNMLLSMHPRFYKSKEDTYGLRIWLPPREKQTLRTPEWLVEDSDSIKRIDQSTQRGYDVESMIAVDIDKE